MKRQRRRRLGGTITHAASASDKAQEHAMRAISQVRSGDCAGASRSLRIASFLHGKSAGLYAKGTRSLEAEQHLDYISRSIDLAMSKLGSLCMVKRR